MYDIKFFDNDNGLIFGGGGTILQTMNGGFTGVQQLFPLSIDYHLYNNYPNPFNPTTLISFSIPMPQFVTLKVYDLVGREVSTLVNQELDAGYHDIKFVSNNLSSGVYFYQLISSKIILTKKMLLLK